MIPKGRGGRNPGNLPTLFSAAAKKNNKILVPLAERMRPRSIADVLGQTHIVGEGKLLTNAIVADEIPSMIMWGPPGSGKTSIARVIAAVSKSRFVPFSAVLGGVPELRQILAKAQENKDFEGGTTILFVDELHRFNRAQQDAFLPHVEDGTIVLIGATTENPSFSVNAPLLSRCRVVRLNALTDDALRVLLKRALVDSEGLADAFQIDDDTLSLVITAASGDARRALNTLEIAALEAKRVGRTKITQQDVAQSNAQATLRYDKAGEEHYNIVSAFIKSMRGSDPDAAVYWLMRMIESGDDPVFLLRRMMIFASEDIGNADPRALDVAVAADAAFQRIGMPEGIYAIAQAAIYLACAPKSNAVTTAFRAAQSDVYKRGSLPVPLHLRNAVTGLMRSDGYGSGYRYPHDEQGGVALGETYLPDGLVGTEYYSPTERGFEKTIAERLRWIRAQRQNAPAKPDVPIEAPVPPGLISADTVPADEPARSDEASSSDVSAPTPSEQV
ncbi:MAG: replication-associated recombination protein A [Polyangiaceae bacterium]|nr:replication-associated recombination protein A [Polyangiaceae bacterium]